MRCFATRGDTSQATLQIWILNGEMKRSVFSKRTDYLGALLSNLKKFKPDPISCQMRNAQMTNLRQRRRYT
jgi:hypothetical protein